MALNIKTARSVDYRLNQFYAKRSLKPVTRLDDLRVPDSLARRLVLTGNRQLMMSEDARQWLREIVGLLEAAQIGGGFADYSDLYSATKKIIEAALSEGLRVENCRELLERLNETLAKEVDQRTFVVLLVGVELEGLDRLDIGEVSIEPAGVALLEAAGVHHAHANVSKHVAHSRAELWLLGREAGTPKVALAKFTENSQLAVGILTVFAAAMHHWGSVGFRIATIMAPEDTYQTSVFSSWAERDRSLVSHYRMPTQRFAISPRIVEQLGDAWDAFPVAVQKQDRSELEDALRRATYWFADAQRDTSVQMKLVKFCTAAESVFSTERDQVVKNVAIGIASTVCFSGRLV